MPARPLSAPEREEVRVWIERGETDAEISTRLDRHRSTVNAEIVRNGGRGVYSGTAAQGRADAQRSRPKVPKLVADRALAAHVEVRLEAKDSPMTISIELARGAHGIVASLSHECIYQGVYAHGTRGPAARAARRPAPGPPLPQAPPPRRRSGQGQPAGWVQPDRAAPADRR
jgi:transposase, IS30 family